MTLRSAQQLEAAEKAFRPCPRDKAAVRGWVTAAQDKSRDCENASVSLGTRFEAAYDAMFNLALAVLNAQGWRARAVDGHHAFVLEAACQALGMTEAVFDRIDAVRDLRNQKYQGVARTDADLREARAALEGFSDTAVAWLQAQHADLLK